MLLSLLLCLLVYCRAAPTDEEIKRKLIYEGSPDTFENRKLVKDMLGSLNLRVRNLHRAGTGSGHLHHFLISAQRTTFTDLSAEAHPDLAEWLFEGDIALTPDQAKAIVRGQNEPQASRKKRAQTNPAGFWSPSYPIYYTLDSSLPSSTVSLIPGPRAKAIQFWTTNTCMNFQENPSGNNRLRFYRGTGCWSYIGKQPSWTSQDISIGSGCDILGTVAHEIGHALGFYHTQSRYDRDSYIWVNLDNVESGQEHNFVKQTTATENHFGLPYDYGSVMHYGGCEL
ncbi:astacin [Cooperia oncophora]